MLNIGSPLVINMLSFGKGVARNRNPNCVSKKQCRVAKGLWQFRLVKLPINKPLWRYQCFICSRKKAMFCNISFFPALLRVMINA
jgi:hypothetical protein